MMHTILMLASCTTPWSWDSEHDLLQNSSFDRWCGETPCGWDLTEGTVTPASSLVRDDPALGVNSGPAEIRQTVTGLDANWWRYSCLNVEVLTYGIDDVQIDIDFEADGTTDWSHRLSSGGWEWRTHTRRIGPPYWVEQLTVTVRADSSSLRLAHVRVTGLEAEDCDRVPYTQSVGTPCETEGDCTTGHCGFADEFWRPAPLYSPYGTPDVCSECTQDQHCRYDEVCGARWSESHALYRSCELADSAALGEVCGTDAQCSSGTCCNGRCSECCATGACGEADEGMCRPRIVRPPSESKILSTMCDVGPRNAGAPCLVDDDCAGSCGGAPLRVCDADGRSCLVDEDCPGNTCVAIGVLDGQCE